jgi:hypothetical protein
VKNSLERENFDFYLWMSQLHLEAAHSLTRITCLSIKEPRPHAVVDAATVEFSFSTACNREVQMASQQAILGRRVAWPPPSRPVPDRPSTIDPKNCNHPLEGKA